MGGCEGKGNVDGSRKNTPRECFEWMQEMNASIHLESCYEKILEMSRL